MSARFSWTLRATAAPPANGQGHAPAAGVDLDAYLIETVYPKLYDRLDGAFPEFSWVKRGDGWEATAWPADFPFTVGHKHPDRLRVYQDRPWWIKVHGHSGVRFLDYVNGGRRPRGQDFPDALKKLCELAGVAYPGREATAEEQERARKREARRSILEDVVCRCEAVLWSERGAAARAYLRDGRGLTDDQVRELRLGLYLSTVEVGPWLGARGHSRQECGDAAVLWRKLEGYVVVPWADEHGRCLTLYGRWPGNDLPLMRDLPAWEKRRAEAFAAWERAAKGAPWEEPAVPKTLALPGKNTKASPFCLDRARRAGHDQLVLLEGVFDAALLQVRGETRAVASVAAQLCGEQLKTLVRCRVRRVYVCGDPDGGGDQGTLANVEALTAAGVEAFVVPRLPDATDPDDFVRGRSVEAWRDLVRQAEHPLTYRARLIVEEHGPEGGPWGDVARESALADAFAVADKVPAGRGAELAEYLWPPLAKALGQDPAGLRQRYREHRARAGGDKPVTGFRWAPIDSAAFAREDCRPQWLVKRLLVRGQPAMIGGPRKALKTSLLVDLAVSLASATQFLGTFYVPRPCRVALLSGESGRFTLQETARRVCAARGLSFASVGDRLLWQFDLPQLADLTDLAELEAGLGADGVEVGILDPLYLALLAGQAGAGIEAGNLYDMGPLLLRVTRACLNAGATPVLAHHTKRASGMSVDPLELDDLAYAGVAEFARQWLLVSRREKYEPGTGLHKLWLNVGGSAGQSGLWSVDVDEGVIDEDFGGRRWAVSVCTGTQEREADQKQKQEEKEAKRQHQEREDETRLLAALDQLDTSGQGAPYQRVASLSGLSRFRMSSAFERLLAGGTVSRIPGLQVEVGNGAKRPAVGIVRRDG
jgi:hypothetical protein